ncbi:lysine 6-monooxygenase (plasmid) [Haloferax mediterranei ATCC 33500]|uniref:Lysine 6-monooxygenase n=1 Tax=Haloferax mediterranei (strain ATCC 33500 / DSM 1411 / JCM 8866 / NBRC 14739 / NCIMB 2177 / R-4) TaxID=523841 RepID=I3R9G8_HALMT|nr:lysine N(6)-hydroxylase/L-ornithine N(5)-oxygenase family protein [Haloferax mediterranei]AFK20878.1 siderophore biosynthesis protein (lysine 6-monooxygenase) [Haloferax mediterranei ATCC 33500]AHZ24253.1 lysine 6-monooxygenase [Haloferax mediterranei ATCC 33500]EMA05332.1 siderophore biosynthesis protein (lysine 6-monooxygenase) [Haloferax mediterranei ATCC 33500]MDX5989866.1 lysine N(6)-hydroxylase/L-ornithine N(5)-oxygenase family protein [Haloferax mediterranei ATCC 33500]QCQ77307.1 lys
MTETPVHDVLGVGLGPFNLGLAALLDGADGSVDAVFLEQEAEFAWHEGMLIEGTTLEVPFLADLVTLADPTSPHSYLNYLRETGRIYQFYFYERFQIPRREYSDYLRWVSERLDTCQFERRVTDIQWCDDGYFEVIARHPEHGEEHRYRAEDVVFGVGSRPYVPDALGGHPERDVFHTAAYRNRKSRCLDADSITVIGSGQSAAEVFLDLLDAQADADYRLDWLTRSEGFFPMEYSKLGLQHFTPEYTQYFTDLPQETRDEVYPEQGLLYKGIDVNTSAEIYDMLYRRSIGDRDPDVGLFAMTEVTDIDRIGGGSDQGDESDDSRYLLVCEQWQSETRFTHESEVVILGTGYHRPTPGFLSPLESSIEWDEHGRYCVTDDYRLQTDDDVTGRIFVQNAELHTHGVGAPDLGLGCYRNAHIVNQLCDRTVYPEDEDTVFQDFSVEEFLETVSEGDTQMTATSMEGSR